MTLLKQFKELVNMSCGDETRLKGCWTARGEYHPGGRGTAELTNGEQQALREKRCICPSFDDFRKFLNDLQVLEEKLYIEHELNTEYKKNSVFLITAAIHLFANAKVKVPDGPTDWEETKERWLSTAKAFISKENTC